MLKYVWLYALWKQERACFNFLIYFVSAVNFSIAELIVSASTPCTRGCLLVLDVRYAPEKTRIRRTFPCPNYLALPKSKIQDSKSQSIKCHGAVSEVNTRTVEIDFQWAWRYHTRRCIRYIDLWFFSEARLLREATRDVFLRPNNPCFQS